MSAQRKKILVFIDWFSPGFRAGGPIKSILNFADLMATDFDVYIYTSDRDLGMQEAYKEIPLNEWVPFKENIFVHYTTPELQTKQHIKKAVQVVLPQYIYLNSIFSKHFSIDVLLQKKYFKASKIILAPRGMLKQTALNFKPFKKKVFLFLAKLKGLYKNVFFHATDVQEVLDIKKHIRKTSFVTEISNCPIKPIPQYQHVEKNEKQLRLIYIGRIHPIKNLHLLLAALQNITSEVKCSIVGVLEDAIYWQKCKEIIEQMPSNIDINFLGPVEPSKLEHLILDNHLLALPTQGENFGHAIYECLALGRPVLISDQTPWNNVSEFDAGWALPLNNMEKFVEKVEYFAALNQLDYNIHCYGALELANRFYENPEIKAKYDQLFS